MEFSFLSIFLAVLSFTCFVLGAVLYLQGGKLSSKLFGSLAITAGAWIAVLIIVFYRYSAAGVANSPYIFNKISFSLGATIFYLLLLFTYSFPQEKLLMRRGAFIAVTFGYAIAFIGSYVPGAVIIKDVLEQGYYMPITVMGDFYTFYYAPLLFLYLGWSVWRLIYIHNRTTNSLDRLRIRYIITGVSISGILGISYDILPRLPLPLGIIPLGHIGVFIFVVLTSYATLRHHLFNVKVIVTELLTFSIWAFLLFRIFLAESIENILVDSSLLVLVVAFGTLLIRSVLGEVKQREQLERISADLNDLKTNLEAKVVQQTVEIKKAYEVEKKARVELEELDKAKDQFILTTQHHLRTPLTIIKGYLAVLKEKFTLPKEASVAVNKMQESAETIANSVNNLLQTTEMNMREVDK